MILVLTVERNEIKYQSNLPAYWAHQAVVRAFPADVYCFRAIAEVNGALRSAGFSIDEGADQSQEQAGKPIFLAAMKRDAAASQAKRSAKDQNDPH
jgi:hypothetical protein